MSPAISKFEPVRVQAGAVKLTIEIIHWIDTILLLMVFVYQQIKKSSDILETTARWYRQTSATANTTVMAEFQPWAHSLLDALSQEPTTQALNAMRQGSVRGLKHMPSVIESGMAGTERAVKRLSMTTEGEPPRGDGAWPPGASVA